MTEPTPPPDEQAPGDDSPLPAPISQSEPASDPSSDPAEADALDAPAVSYVKAPPADDPWAHRRTEPRPFALLWILYLIVAALVAFGAASSFLRPTADMYRHATRVLFFLAALGVSLFWPLLRLSQSRPASAPKSVLLDLAVLLPPLQCVVWPQLFDWMARWSVPTVACVAATYACWALLIGALLSIALKHSAGPRELTRSRSLWMVVFLSLTVVGPACALSFSGNDRVERWLLASPVGGILDMVRDRSYTGQFTHIEPEHWWALGIVASIALALWLLPLLRSSPPTESIPNESAAEPAG